jgi:hypothetical protein
MKKGYKIIDLDVTEREDNRFLGTWNHDERWRP